MRLAKELLVETGWPGEGRTPQPFESHDILERIVGGLQRTLPTLEPRLFLETLDTNTAAMLVLDTSGQSGALYRVTFRRYDDNNAKLQVERIDLRRVVNISVTEDVAPQEGNLWLTSQWHFEFDGADPLDIDHGQIDPDLDPPGKPHQFGRQVAEAAGWTPWAAERASG